MKNVVKLVAWVCFVSHCVCKHVLCALGPFPHTQHSETGWG